jgi:hypothetical protein
MVVDPLHAHVKAVLAYERDYSEWQRESNAQQQHQQHWQQQQARYERQITEFNFGPKQGPRPFNQAGIRPEQVVLRQPVRPNPPPHLHFAEYRNENGYLPRTRGGRFFEARVGAARDGSAGTHRIVIEVDNQGRILSKYYTGDHYGDHAMPRKPSFEEFF